MMKNVKFSDEFLNAFIDGELDQKETGLILDEIRRNPDLSARITDLHKIREMVRYAYSDIDMPTRKKPYNPKRVKMWRAVAAGMILMLGVSIGWVMQGFEGGNRSLIELANAVQINQPPQNKDFKLVLHVTTGDTHRLAVMLDETERLLQDQEKQHHKVKLDILANGQGLNLLRADTSQFAERIHELRTRYNAVTFKACQQAINRLKQEKGITATMLPDTEVVPSAIGEIIQRQHEGWTYVRI